MKAKMLFTALLLCLMMISGCESSKVQKTVTLPEDIPSFVIEKDFEKIDWDRTVTVFDTGERDDMVGNKNKIGFIGPDFKANEVQKWLWHFWGVDSGKLTIVGYNQDTLSITPVLTNGWYAGFGGGKIAGADSSMPSNVSFSDSGKWALLVYVDEKLFDILVIDIKD